MMKKNRTKDRTNIRYLDNSVVSACRGFANWFWHSCNVGRFKLLAMGLICIIATSTGSAQTGLDPANLIDGSLSAYPTDFMHGKTLKTYSSPNIYKLNTDTESLESLWTEEDMYTIDIRPYMSVKNKVEEDEFGAPAGIKAEFDASDFPNAADKNKPAITVMVYLIDEDLVKSDKRTEGIAQAVVKFYTTYNLAKEAKEKNGGNPDFVHQGWAHNGQNCQYTNGYGNKSYNTLYIKQFLRYGCPFKKIGNKFFKGANRVVIEIHFYKPGKVIALDIPPWGEFTPQQILYAKGKGTFQTPTKNEEIQEFTDNSALHRWTWSGDDRLYGTNQVFNIAELDFSQDSDLELKLDYVFKDPRSNPNNFNPKTFRNSDGTPGISTADEMAAKSSLNQAKSILIDQPQSGMFDIVSNRVAKAGALMAVNGTFYDYYYYCLPGVKSSLKMDGSWKYTPDIFNHRNTGALLFDFTGNSPSFQMVKNATVDTYLGDATGSTYDQAKNAYNSYASWPNLISGGHFSEKGKPFRFYKPKVSGSLDYFWEKPDDFYNNMPSETIEKYADWNGQEFSTWGSIACQRLDDRNKTSDDYMKDPEEPNLFSFSDAFTDDLLTDTNSKTITIGDKSKSVTLSHQDRVNIYTSVDYIRYSHEFGLQKRGRTFVGIKNSKLYIMTVDGIYQASCNFPPSVLQQPKIYWPLQYYGKHAPGLTIDELSDFSQRMEFDALMNLDGGGSSTFYVNGKGMVQNPYAGVSEGPLQQRFLSTTLMVVPKIKSTNIKNLATSSTAHLVFDNKGISPDQYKYHNVELCTYPDNNKATDVLPIVDYNKWKPVKALSLSPSLEKLTPAGAKGIVAGSFNAGLASEGTEGAILFAMSENGQYSYEKDPKTNKDKERKIIKKTNSVFVIGVGKIPDVLLDTLKRYQVIDQSPAAQTNYEGTLQVNKSAFYAILVSDRQVHYYLFDVLSSKSWDHYLDGNWHNFILYNTVGEGSGVNKFRMVIDGTEEANTEYIYRDHGLTFFDLGHVTNAMVGAAPISGSYITSLKSNLKVDNYIFVPHAKVDGFVTSLKTKTSKTDVFEAMKAMGTQIKNNIFDYQGLGFGENASGPYCLQFEENTGWHAHQAVPTSVSNPTADFYGLNLWGEWEASGSSARMSASKAALLKEDNVLKHSWSVYPNPAESELQLDITLEESTWLEIQLVNINGQVMATAKATRLARGKHKIRLDNLISHIKEREQIYLLKVTGEGFEQITSKLIMK